MTPEDLLAILNSCFCEALAAGPNPPSQCCVLASEPQITDCCAGVAWTRVLNIYPSNNFPAADAKPDRCLPPSWAMTVQLGIFRCAPATCAAMDNPCCDSHADAVTQQFADRSAMLQSALCCLPNAVRQIEHFSMDRVVLGTWAVIETEGVCVGSSINVTIQFADPCVCP